ncbi:MAG TPA: AMP-binding protein, partial [Candidatus Binatia bacterium]
MLYRALCKQARKHPHKAAVIGERKTLSYAQLLRQVNHAALYFRRCRLGAGDRLVIGMPPCPEFYVLFYAAAALGIAVIPVSATGHLAERARALGAVAAAG